MSGTSAILGAALVSVDGTPREHYELVHLKYQLGGEARCVNFVLIAQVAEGGVLVAAPSQAWSRTANERKLPRGALSRALLVEVMAASIDAPEVALEEQNVQLWVGVMDPKLVSRLQVGGGENPTYDVWVTAEDEEGASHTLIPFGPALASVAEENFAFASAASDMEAFPSMEGGPAEAAGLEGRVEKMESALEQIQELLQRGLGASSAAQTRKPALRPTGQTRVRFQEKPTEIKGLDPTVVSSALQAGIPEEQLVTLSGLLKKTSKMEDVPRQKPSRGVLSESEDEEEEPELVGEESTPDEVSREPHPAVAKAVVQLTKIVGSLATQTSKQKDLDSLLDMAEGGSADSSSSSSSSRSKAAAFKKLRSALSEAAEKLSKTIEEAIDEDFLQVRMIAGVSSQDFSTRAWVEHRSKLQHYPQTIRMAWILAGAHDAMRRKKFEEAKARILLGLVALDQASLDGGNWALAQEVLLEPPAPFHSFVGRKLPEPWEQTTSKLLDDRVADVLMWRLKDRDSFVEARKRLQSPSKSVPRTEPQQNVATPKPGPKKAPKAKGKGGGKTAPEEEPPAAT